MITGCRKEVTSNSNETLFWSESTQKNTQRGVLQTGCRYELKTQKTTTHNKTRLSIGGVIEREFTPHKFICLHSSVSCIGILSLSDCNESAVWTVPSALSPSDFSSVMGGWDATPGEGSWVWELTGELVLWGGAAGSRAPFRWELPAAQTPSANPSPFGIASELTGPER